MDAREFYAQIDKADDEFKTVGVDLYKIFRDTDHLQYIFSDLAEKAAEIEDEEQRERFESVLSYLSERLYEIGEECYKLSAEIEEAREYDLSELVIEADEIAEEEKKKPLTNGNS
jgi:hypothetical protein